MASVGLFGNRMRDRLPGKQTASSHPRIGLR